MMETISQWIRGVVITSLLVSVLVSLTPEGVFRRIARLTGGLIFLLVALQGMKNVDVSAVTVDFETYKGEIEGKREEFEKENESIMLQSIEEKAQAYILDKAKLLGLDVTAQVEAAVDESGVYSLTGVRLSGTYNAELSDWISETLGVGAEKQEWSSG